MRQLSISFAIVAGVSLSLGACAANTPDLTTQAIPTKVAQPKSDPACTALAAQIAQVEREGTVGRVEKAGSGNTRLVHIKRASLLKVAELNRLNSEYRTKCSASLSAPKATPSVPASAANGVTSTAQAAATRAANAKVETAKAQATVAAAKVAAKATQ
ncbi:MAG: hypothetical protein AAFZ05_02265 [Pseudomonadota bacterium]